MNLKEFFQSDEWKMVEDRWERAYDQLSRIGDSKTIKELEGKKWAAKVLSDFMDYLRGEAEWTESPKKKTKSYIVTKSS